MNASRSLLVLSVGLILVLPSRASADAWLPQPGDWYSEFRASHLSSGDRFDTLGVRQFHPFGSIFEGRELLAYNELGWKNRVSLVVALPARSATQRSDPLGTTRTVTGFGDLTLGARYGILRGATGLTLQAEWKAPLGYQHTSSPTLGDGQQDVAGRLNLGMAVNSIDGFFEVSGGYRHRFQDPPDEIEYGADIGVWVRSMVLLEGRYDGFTSTGADSVALESQAHVVGGRVTIRIDDRLDVFAGSMHLIDGKNVGKYDRYFAGIAFKRTHLNRLQGFLGGKRGP